MFTAGFIFDGIKLILRDLSLIRRLGNPNYIDFVYTFWIS